MGYYARKIDLQEAQRSAKKYTYALIFTNSERILCKTEDLSEIEWDEVQEARFFSDDRELHIFEGEEGRKAVEVSDKCQENIVVKKYELDEKFGKLGKTVLVQEYLVFDEDGQASVGLTRLKGIR